MLCAVLDGKYKILRRENNWLSARLVLTISKEDCLGSAFLFVAFTQQLKFCIYSDIFFRHWHNIKLS